MYTDSAVLKHNSAKTRFSVDLPFPDRRRAGRELSQSLELYRDRQNTIVVALPRGGVSIAKEVATTLQLPMEFIAVRKIGVPGYDYLTMGAVAQDNVLVWNETIVQRIKNVRQDIDNAVRDARIELQRMDMTYRGNRPFPQFNNQNVIIVDDGMETGASMRAAIETVRMQLPAKIIASVPVSNPETADLMCSFADEVVVLATPEPFYGVAEWYFDYKLPSDTEICEMLYGV